MPWRWAEFKPPFWRSPTRLRVTSKINPGFWKEGQRLVQVTYEHGEALVEIVNESGKLDLNVAGREQLARLFEARGLEPADATQLAAAIDHWRSPAGSDDRGVRGLGRVLSRRRVCPAHQPFGSVEEVLRVRGMSRDIFYGTAEFSREEENSVRYTEWART